MFVFLEPSAKKKIRGIIFFILLGSLWMLGSGLAQAAPATWSMGYYTPWGNPSLPISAIYWPSLTHISKDMSQ
jgi:hypothetical protein